MFDDRQIAIVKTHPGNVKPPIRYAARPVHCEQPGWLAYSAEWMLPDTVVAGIRFETGCELIEYFSPTARYNVFRVHDRKGKVTGLYCNVTALVRISDDGSELVWEDRWLDAVKLADGSITILDEDEYEASGVPDSDPELDQEIRGALQELVASLSRGDWDD